MHTHTHTFRKRSSQPQQNTGRGRIWMKDIQVLPHCHLNVAPTFKIEGCRDKFVLISPQTWVCPHPTPSARRAGGSCSSDHHRHREGGRGWGCHGVPLLHTPPGYQSDIPMLRLPSSSPGRPSKCEIKQASTHTALERGGSKLKAQGSGQQKAVLRATAGQHCPLQAPR